MGCWYISDLLLYWDSRLGDKSSIVGAGLPFRDSCHRSLAVARSLAPQANKDSASPEKEVFLVNLRKWFRDAGDILATTKER